MKPDSCGKCEIDYCACHDFFKSRIDHLRKKKADKMNQFSMLLDVVLILCLFLIIIAVTTSIF